MLSQIWLGLLICLCVWGALIYNLVTVARDAKNGKKAPMYSDCVLKEMKENGIEPWLTEEPEP
ncbi:MAG: hypothetical protein IK116_03595 [Firmicutes bacterium]|nr:hypothetical protein [Bacillota bacterium]